MWTRFGIVTSASPECTVAAAAIAVVIEVAMVSIIVRAKIRRIIHTMCSENDRSQGSKSETGGDDGNAHVGL